jgi:hypothetical protein
MAFVRQRTTKTGSISTTLVESYRDQNGRPRQRILANLHGEPDTLQALVKLAAMRDTLLERLEEEHAEPRNRGEGFVLVSERALTKHNRRLAQCRQLTTIERDMAAIGKHLPPVSDAELRQAARRYMEDYCRAVKRVMGLAVALKQAEAVLRRKDR